MEELQDALEDAQYVNAITLDEGPRPVTAWERPPDEDMDAWMAAIRRRWLRKMGDLDHPDLQIESEVLEEVEADSEVEIMNKSEADADAASGEDQPETEANGSAAEPQLVAEASTGLKSVNSSYKSEAESKSVLSLSKLSRISKSSKSMSVKSRSKSKFGSKSKSGSKSKVRSKSKSGSKSKSRSNSKSRSKSKSKSEAVVSLARKYDDIIEDDSGPPGPEPFTYEWVLSTSLGFFMFSSFIKDHHTSDYAQLNFIEENMRWRYLRGRSRGYKLKRIYKRYLSPAGIDPETNAIKVPPLSHIDECDLEFLIRGEKFTPEELDQHMRENMDPRCSKCCIGIDGPLRDEVIKKLEELVCTGSTVFTENFTIDDFSMQTSLSSNSARLLNGITTENTDIQDHSQENEMSNNGDDEENNGGGKSFDALNSQRKSLRSRALCKAPDDIFDKIEQIVIESMRLKHWKNFVDSGEYSKLLTYLWHSDKKVTDEDFFLMRVLGRGGFGLVTACKKGTTGTLYAMKVMNKKRIKAKKSERLALNERACLAAVDSPFVVNLKYSFQTRDDLYLILDLMTGGDLSFHLSQKGRFPTEECLYYAARIMLGLQALHDKNYVYRDLKPENLLLAEDGRVRITDLGLATQVTPRLHGVAGTRGYWAPEMLRRNEKGKRMKYDQRVDWFSFGCVVAEMICGCNPFRSETALKFGLRMTETKEKALDYATLHMDPSFESKKFTRASTDLCKRLLDKDPDTRLGANGCEEIMAHPWFKDINWELIQSDREIPPFVPLKDINAASQSEIGTFAEDRNAPRLSDEDQEVYKDWDWTSPRVFSAEVIDMLIYERETGRPLVPLTVGGSCCCTVM